MPPRRFDVDSDLVVAAAPGPVNSALSRWDKLSVSFGVKVPVGKEESRGSPVRVSHPPVSSLGSITELPVGSEQHGLSVGRESYRP